MVSVNGEGFQDNKVLEFHVKSGTQHSQRISFQGEVDEGVGFRILFINKYL